MSVWFITHAVDVYLMPADSAAAIPAEQMGGEAIAAIAVDARLMPARQHCSDANREDVEWRLHWMLAGCLSNRAAAMPTEQMLRGKCTRFAASQK